MSDDGGSIPPQFRDLQSMRAIQPASRGMSCLPLDYYVEHGHVLGVLPHAPDAGFGNAVPTADSGVGMRPLRRLVATGKEDFP
jgi:hypothetical protein